jgi:LDH2 family malate/lactate/ureidoglycolate dehydrogenase
VTAISAGFVHVREDVLEARVLAELRAAGADDPSAAAATRAMMHAARLGIDSHGVRLTAHYAKVMRSGRVNPRPAMTTRVTAAGTALVDADNGLGHAAAYKAMGLACERAREAGIAAVGVIRSSHYGAAGAYAFAAAEAGFIGLTVCNANSSVALHGGKAPFHGTNPIAVAAPVPGQMPWLLDMATSALPLNRVRLYRTLDKDLPDGVAADADGQSTRDPAAVEMLMPLGGTDYGYKGAGLAGFATLLSAILIGAPLDADVIPMFATGDFSTPRQLGQFCLAIDPARFAGRARYDQAIMRYLQQLRGSPARAGEAVLAPGDREWAIEAERQQTGIPIDAETAKFLGLDAAGA